MDAFALYTQYLHNRVLRAIVIREMDAKTLAEKWGCAVEPIPSLARFITDQRGKQ